MRVRAIDIEAFRGYNEKVHFNFTVAGGEIADLVAIYAPNGFGKTSFFDAVEWALKSEIERFEDDSIMKNSAKREGGSILKNTYSDREQGSVKIIDEYHGFFERLTTKRVADKWDLVKGVVNSSSNSTIKHDIKNYDLSNRIEILPQSRIDAFVASKTPSDRYEALVNFWGGKDDSLYFKGVNEMCKVNDKHIESLEKEIKDLESELNDISQNNEIYIYLNVTIQNLIEFGIYELKNTNLESIKSKNDVNNFALLINNSISRIDILNDNYQSTKATVEGLKRDLPRQISLESEIKSLTNEINTINNLISNNQKNLINKQKLVENTEVIKIKNGDLDIAKELLNNVPFFENHERNLIDCKKSIMLSIVEQKDIQIKIDSLSYDKLNCQSLLDRARNNSKKAKDNINFFSFSEKSYIKNAFELNIINSRIQLLNNIINQIVDSLSNLTDTYKNNNKFISFSLESLLHEREINLKYALPLNLDIIRSGIQKLEEDKNQLNSQRQKTISLSNNVDQIIKLAISHLHATKDTNCPLCNTSFESYEDLLERIHKSKADVLNIDNFITKIDEIDKEIEIIKSNTNKILNKHKQDLEKENSSLKNNISALEIRQSTFTDYLNYYRNKKFQLEEFQNNVLLKCEIKNHESPEFDLLKKEAYNSDNILSIEIGSLEKRLSLLTKQIGDFNEQMVKSRSKSASLEVQLSVLLNDELIEHLVANFNYLNINTEDNLDEKLQSLIKNIEEQIFNLKNMSESLVKSISNYSESNPSVDISSSRDNLLILEFDLNKLKEEQYTYKNIYSKLIGNSKFNEEELTINLINLNKDIQKNEVAKINLFQVRENISLLFSNLNYNEKTNKLLSLNDTLAKYIQNKVPLESTLKKLTSFLIDKINSVFNHQLINDIYQKIDPHPQFKTVKLIPIFENEKPELLIKVYDKFGKENIDPLLYLSAAQVNILSLSIFLAKSIQNKDLLLDTILMDDPVQYLDSINILSFIDLLRAIITDKLNSHQIIISTHDENFYKLLQKKFDPKYYHSKFIEFESYGRLKSESIY